MANNQQIEKLLKRNSTFGQGQQWYVMGFKSIGSHAIIKAHVLQLEKEREAKIKAAEKVANVRRPKYESAAESFGSYKTIPGKMKLDDWKCIVDFYCLVSTLTMLSLTKHHLNLLAMQKGRLV